MNLNKIVKPLAVAAAVLVLGSGTAVAATGGTFILGRANGASTETNLKNTGAGATLSLSAARAGQVPLAVSAGAGKATNLNADRIDGLDGGALALAAGRVGQLSAQSRFIDLDDDGQLDPVLEAYAACPAGSKVTGGGFAVFTSFGAVINRADGNGWLVITLADADSDETDLLAHAQCYNPRGAVSGASAQFLRSGSASSLTDAEKAQIASQLR